MQVLPRYKDLYDLFVERFHKKRQLGISQNRDDGSRRDPDIDGNAGCAEFFVGELLGVPVNLEFFGFGGDGGEDLTAKFRLPSGVKTCGIGVQWLGYREYGNILINVNDPARYEKSDFFVLVGGNVFDDFQIKGWASKKTLYATTPRDFGYGMRYYKGDHQLQSFDKLLQLLERE